MNQYLSTPALSAIFSSKGAERVLLYLQNYGEGYAKAIADTFGMSISQVQNQLQKFEAAGVLVSRPVGTARIYYWNQRNPTVEYLREFLQRALDDLPSETIQAYFRQRRRPRRPAKRLS